MNNKSNFSNEENNPFIRTTLEKTSVSKPTVKDNKAQPSQKDDSKGKCTKKN